LKDYIT